MNFVYFCVKICLHLLPICDTILRTFIKIWNLTYIIVFRMLFHKLQTFLLSSNVITKFILIRVIGIRDLKVYNSHTQNLWMFIKFLFKLCLELLGNLFCFLCSGYCHFCLSATMTLSHISYPKLFWFKSVTNVVY